jgi:hypothetical protein
MAAKSSDDKRDAGSLDVRAVVAQLDQLSRLAQLARVEKFDAMEKTPLEITIHQIPRISLFPRDSVTRFVLGSTENKPFKLCMELGMTLENVQYLKVDTAEIIDYYVRQAVSKIVQKGRPPHTFTHKFEGVSTNLCALVVDDGYLIVNADRVEEDLLSIAQLLLCTYSGTQLQKKINVITNCNEAFGYSLKDTWVNGNFWLVGETYEECVYFWQIVEKILWRESIPLGLTRYQFRLEEFLEKELFKRNTAFQCAKADDKVSPTHAEDSLKWVQQLKHGFDFYNSGGEVYMKHFESVTWEEPLQDYKVECLTVSDALFATAPEICIDTSFNFRSVCSDEEGDEQPDAKKRKIAEQAPLSQCFNANDLAAALQRTRK